MSEYFSFAPLSSCLFTERKRSLDNLVWNRAPKHRYKRAHPLETAVMLAVLSFNSSATSRLYAMEGIPGGEFTFEECTEKDQQRMSHSIRKAKGEGREACSKPG